MRALLGGSRRFQKKSDLEDFFVDTGSVDCLDSLLATDRVESAVCADRASCDECNGFFEAVECHDLRRRPFEGFR